MADGPDPGKMEVYDGTFTLEINTTAKAIHEGQRAAGEGVGLYDCPYEGDQAVAWVKGWVSASVNGDGEKGAEAAKRFYGEGFDQEQFDRVRKELKAYKTNILEFIEDAEINMEGPDLLGRIVAAYDAIGG